MMSGGRTGVSRRSARDELERNSPPGVPAPRPVGTGGLVSGFESGRSSNSVSRWFHVQLPAGSRSSSPVSLWGYHDCRGRLVVPTRARHRPSRESCTGTEPGSELENCRSARSNSRFQRRTPGRRAVEPAGPVRPGGRSVPGLAACGHPRRRPLPRRPVRFSNAVTGRNTAGFSDVQQSASRLA